MESTYNLPVETILKVDENKIVIGEDKEIPQAFLPTNFNSNITQHDHEKVEFHEFDYKTRNKFQTKQRRLDPLYRTEERIRQRTVMRMKRQDPQFRAAEREKGRYRMRIKRLDPAFRSEERERQRERMKIKRSDPNFREKEREKQKTRLQEKRLDSDFLEKEKTQDQWRMCIKRQNDSLCSDKNKSKFKNANIQLVPESKTFKGNTIRDFCDYATEMRNTQAVFPENVNKKILSINSKEATIEAFNFKKQRILNLNFYNNNSEESAIQDELCSKTISRLSVEGRTIFQASLTEAESSNLSYQVNSSTS